jgi:hypothetical protein
MWKMAELAVNNNHSLTQYIKLVEGVLSYITIAGTRGTDLPSPSPLFLYFFFITFCLHIYFQ